MSLDAATLGVVVAVLALIYQAGAYYVSRRELTLKVKDLGELVARLDREGEARAALAKQHDRLSEEALQNYVDALNYTTRLGKTHTETMKALGRNSSGGLADTQYVLLALNLAARSGASNNSAFGPLLEAAFSLCIARINQTAVCDRWDHERYSGAAAIEQDDSVSLDERNDRLTSLMARLEGKYTGQVDTMNAELHAARDRFLSLLGSFVTFAESQDSMVESRTPGRSHVKDQRA